MPVKYELVESFEIPVKIKVHKVTYDDSDAVHYDWSASNGHVPEEFFESAQEAIDDAWSTF